MEGGSARDERQGALQSIKCINVCQQLQELFEAITPPETLTDSSLDSQPSSTAAVTLIA